MSDIKWTPGPWKVYADDEVYSTTAKSAEDYPITVVPDSECGRDDYGVNMANRQQSRANAHLIAAAPELYEMLDMLMDASGLGDSAQLLAEERENIIELLAKARGEV